MKKIMFPIVEQISQEEPKNDEGHSSPQIGAASSTCKPPYLGADDLPMMTMDEFITLFDGDDKAFITLFDGDDKASVGVAAFYTCSKKTKKFLDYDLPIDVADCLERIIVKYSDLLESVKLPKNEVTSALTNIGVTLLGIGTTPFGNVTLDMLLAWRDVCRSSDELGFNVDFLAKHVRKLAIAVNGFHFRNRLSNMNEEIGRLSSGVKDLKDEVSDLRKERNKLVKELHNKHRIIMALTI